MRLDLLLASLMLASIIVLTGTGCAGGSVRGEDPYLSAQHGGPGASSRRSGRSEDAQNRRANSDVLVELGQRYYERGEYQLALEKLQSAIDIDSNSANAHSVIAMVYETVDMAERAGQFYRRSAQLAPRDGSIQNNYGNWLCRQQRFAEADQAFRSALADPFYRTPDAALANAGSCALAAGRLEAAEDYLQRALRLHPQDIQALLGMADLTFRRGDFMRARAFLQRADAQGGLARPGLELAVQVEEKLGDTGSAAAYRARLAQGEGG